MGYARLRPELNRTWKEWELNNLDGTKTDWAPDDEWVKSVCFDGVVTGLYVLTDDDDYYFTCHSIDLEFADQLPEGETNG